MYDNWECFEWLKFLKSLVLCVFFFIVLGKIFDVFDDFGLRDYILVYFILDYGGYLEARLGYV